MSDDRVEIATTETPSTPRLTVIGLFEDAIDANQALADLRKIEPSPETVSLIVRERDAAEDGSHDTSAVATALAQSSLDQAADWLVHFVSLIVPDHGAFLVAGPIGAMVAGSAATIHRDTPDTDENEVEHPTGANDEPRPIAGALLHFGYGTDEAAYLAKRVHAGSILIGCTTPDAHSATDVRRIFADRSAVHIGTNWTDPEAATQADALIRGPVEPPNDDEVVVLDSVALLVGLCSQRGSETGDRYRGVQIVDCDGSEAGIIEDLLAEVMPPAISGGESVRIRYVVIGFGGLLGIGRGRVAVPVNYVLLDDEPIRLTVDARMIQSAPSYQTNKPFSRQEEELICTYFDCPPYWRVT